MMAKKKKVDKKKKDLPVLKQKLSFSQKSADLLTSFVGSWKFIFSLFIFMIFWISLNVYMIVNQWDPYPFILLNFVLSCLAAVQAPIILMSQNRTTERDRIRFEHDYSVNRKAEREIEHIQRDLDSIKRLLLKKRR